MIGLLIKYPTCIKYAKDFNSDMLSAGFIKKAYEITKRLIENSVPTDLIQYSGELTDNELGRLSGIIARSSESLNPKGEVQDCIKAISDEYNAANKNSEIDISNNDTFLSELNKLGKNNNNNT